MSTATVLAKVIAHGEREGRDDYLGRAEDVDAGRESLEWAWPFRDADDAYINAVGISKICAAIGIPESRWDDVGSEWAAAFRRGYEAARDDRTRRRLMFHFTVP